MNQRIINQKILKWGKKILRWGVKFVLGIIILFFLSVWVIAGKGAFEDAVFPKEKATCENAGGL